MGKGELSSLLEWLTHGILDLDVRFLSSNRRRMALAQHAITTRPHDFAGGDAQYGAKRSRSGLIQRIRSMDRMESLKGMKQDLTVLKSIWFKKASGSDHAERLESFYGPQAAACECSIHCIALCGTHSSRSGRRATCAVSWRVDQSVKLRLRGCENAVR